MRWSGWLVLMAALVACDESSSGAATAPPEPTAVVDSTTSSVVSTVAQPAVTSAPVTTVAVTTQASVPDGSGSGLDGTWRATSGVVNAAPVQLIDAAPIEFTFDGSRLVGTAACNGFQVVAEIDGRSVELVDGFVNEVGCEPAIAALQDLFLDSFGPAATFAIEEHDLVWRTPTATWIFERVPPTPDADLAGVTWTLDGVVYEFGGMTTPWISDGRIDFADDGTVTGSTSCRDFTGRWSRDGETIQIGDVELVGTCDGDRAEIDGIVAQVLAEGFIGSVDGRLLSARPRTDLGLVYRTTS